jgi:hypothetical protein
MTLFDLGYLAIPAVAVLGLYLNSLPDPVPVSSKTRNLELGM